MKNIMWLWMFWFGLLIPSVEAVSLLSTYNDIMETLECRQTPVSSGIIDYEVGMFVVDNGQIEIILDPGKVILQWGTTEQAFDFSTGIMTYNGVHPTTQVKQESIKNCYEYNGGSNCYSLGKLYGDIFLNRPLKYLKATENPNRDHLNSVVCAQNLVKTFSDFFKPQK